MRDLEFGGRLKEPDIRWLHDMSDVIYDQSWLRDAKNFELYFMYRDLYLSLADRDLLLDQGLRYDITIIPPGMLGIEYIKTAGHYHPIPKGGRVSYPEIYEVLEGEALYLLQKRDLSDVVAVNALAGDKVLVPPDYGHVTINRSNKTLKMANFVARDFQSLYEPYREKAGGAYYFTKEGFIENPRFTNAAKLMRIDVPDNGLLQKLGMAKKREMYPLLRDPCRLDFLVHPEMHIDLFEGFI
jgi:glucose-6-phosphate isomerase, archaeal